MHKIQECIRLLNSCKIEQQYKNKTTTDNAYYYCTLIPNYTNTLLRYGVRFKIF